MKRKLIIFTLLIFSFSTLVAAPGYDFHKKGHKNFHGKRMMEEDGEFYLLFVEAKEIPDFYNFKFVFSQPVNPKSLKNENFLLNGNEIHFKKIRFSKNYMAIDFLITPEAANFAEDNNDLLIKGIESINGNIIEPVVIKNFQIEKDYKLMRKFER